MRMRLFSPSLPWLLGSLLIAEPAAAQISSSLVDTRTPPVAPGDGRVALEGFYARTWLDDRAVAGAGARLLWHLAPTGFAETEARPLAARTALGLIGLYTPEDERGTSTLRLGVEGVVRPLPAPLFGRIDPVLSLSGGAMRMERDDLARRPLLFDPPPSDRVRTHAMVAPGAGLRVGLVRNLALAADARDVIVFDDGARHEPELAAGLSVVF